MANTQLIVPGNASPSQVLSGQTFSAGTNYNAPGTMPNKVGSGTILTPGTADIAIPQGYFGGVVGDGKVKGDAYLVSGNIVKGTSIFNVAGSIGRRATGTFSSLATLSTNNYGITVSGLSFQPSLIYVTWNYTGGSSNDGPDNNLAAGYDGSRWYYLSNNAYRQFVTAYSNTPPGGCSISNGGFTILVFQVVSGTVTSGGGVWWAFE